MFLIALLAGKRISLLNMRGLFKGLALQQALIRVFLHLTIRFIKYVILVMLLQYFKYIKTKRFGKL